MNSGWDLYIYKSNELKEMDIVKENSIFFVSILNKVFGRGLRERWKREAERRKRTNK